MGLVGRDFQRVPVLALPRQDHHHPLPVSAGHFGHIAVEQPVRVIHHQVPQVIRPQETPLAGVTAADVAQQLASLLVNCLQRRLLQLGRKKSNGHQLTQTDGDLCTTSGPQLFPSLPLPCFFGGGFQGISVGFLGTVLTLNSTCFGVFNAWTRWGQKREQNVMRSKMRRQEDQECRKGHETSHVIASPHAG